MKVMTEAEYQLKLERIRELIDLDPKLDTPEGQELDQLATEVEAYEKEHYPLDGPFED